MDQDVKFAHICKLFIKPKKKRKKKEEREKLYTTLSLDNSNLVEVLMNYEQIF